MSPAQALAQGSDFYKLRVIDSQTGRGVPLVQVSVAGEQYFTDSNGLLAIDSPNLLDQVRQYDLASYGYGSTSLLLTASEGTQNTLTLNRLNRAERLYRATGAGIYRDSVALGEPVPIAKPISNANVLGQDSVQPIIYDGQVYWFWGDTLYEDGGGVGGNYWTSGAKSQLPAAGGLNPSQGIDYQYFEDGQGQARAMFPQYRPTGKPVWIDGLFTVLDETGAERLLSHYVNVESFLPTYVLREQGLAIYDDRQERFLKIQDYGVAPEQQFGTGPPIVPVGHSFRHSTGGVDYIYFGENYPNVRVRDNWQAVNDITQWEAFTPLQAGARYDADNPPLELDAFGEPVYGWKKNTDPLGTEIFEEMVARGHLSRADAPVGLVDFETGRDVRLHRSSVYWNEYRNKWIMIGNESAGEGSFLGEVWFSEAPTPSGPWKDAIKVATHADPTGALGGSYSFYNPTQLPFFDEQDGRIIYFQGTYSTNFFDSAPMTPEYEYNQITYRLDLSTIPQLAPDVPPADFNADGLVDSFDLATWQSSYGLSALGDANDDGRTDGADFLVWQRSQGSSFAVGGPLAVQVPEPGGAVLGLGLSLLCALKTWGNRK